MSVLRVVICLFSLLFAYSAFGAESFTTNDGKVLVLVPEGVSDLFPLKNGEEEKVGYTCTKTPSGLWKTQYNCIWASVVKATSSGFKEVSISGNESFTKIRPQKVWMTVSFVFLFVAAFVANSATDYKLAPLIAMMSIVTGMLALMGDLTLEFQMTFWPFVTFATSIGFIGGFVLREVGRIKNLFLSNLLTIVGSSVAVSFG